MLLTRNGMNTGKIDGVFGTKADLRWQLGWALLGAGGGVAACWVRSV